MPKWICVDESFPPINTSEVKPLSVEVLLMGKRGQLDFGYYNHSTQQWHLALYDKGFEVHKWASLDDVRRKSWNNWEKFGGPPVPSPINGKQKYLVWDVRDNGPRMITMYSNGEMLEESGRIYLRGLNRYYSHWSEIDDMTNNQKSEIEAFKILKDVK